MRTTLADALPADVGVLAAHRGRGGAAADGAAWHLAAERRAPAPQARGSRPAPICALLSDVRVLGFCVFFFTQCACKLAIRSRDG